jgi:hypothetical protein
LRQGIDDVGVVPPARVGDRQSPLGLGELAQLDLAEPQLVLGLPVSRVAGDDFLVFHRGAEVVASLEAQIPAFADRRGRSLSGAGCKDHGRQHTHQDRQASIHGNNSMGGVGKPP